METEEEIDREMDRWIEGYLAQTHRLGTRRYRTIQNAHTYVKTASLLVPTSLEETAFRLSADSLYMSAAYVR
jgi:hypothetical protein